ncbi:MAG: hypothetical protein Q4C05_08050 [Akkermansia sp.]|nr:hypothetical protein [Akkermansia sp.]
MHLAIIQTEAEAGNFPRNLRQIVTLYRECVDHQAELVIAPCQALSGIAPFPLTQQSGFKHQHRAALDYIAKEIMSIPLILAEYLDNELQFFIFHQGNCYPQSLSFSSCESASFCIIRIAEAPHFSIRAIHAAYLQPLPEFIVHLDNTPWSYSPDGMDDSEWSSFSKDLGIPIALVRPAGCCDTSVFPGNSKAWSADGVQTLYLPPLQADSGIINVDEFIAHEPVTAKSALKKAITHLLGHEHRTICLYLDESPHAHDFASFLKELYPQLSIIGICQQSEPSSTTIPIVSLPKDICEPELLAAHIRLIANQHNALWFSSFTQTDFILNHSEIIPFANQADLAPLLEFFASELTEIFPTSRHLSTTSSDRFLCALLRQQISATELITLYPNEENIIRKLQRLISQTHNSLRRPARSLALGNIPTLPIKHALKD